MSNTNYTEMYLGEQTSKAMQEHEEVLRTHAHALAAHCGCMAMNAENMIAAIAAAPSCPHPEAHYVDVMVKWGLINDKGEPLI